MQKALLIMAVMAFLMVVGGCGGSGGEPINGDPFDAALVGAWQLFEATADGNVVAPGDAMDWDAGVVRLHVEFGDDGTFTQRVYASDNTEIRSETGTWSTDSGQVTIEVGSEDPVVGGYQVEGNLLTVTVVEGEELVLRWSRVVDLTEQASLLARTWSIERVLVNGAEVAIGDYFGWKASSDAAVLIFGVDGTLTYFELDGIDITGGDQGQWATGGGMISMLMEGRLLRGAYLTSSASVTFLDTDGSSVHFDLQPFVQEVSERDRSLIGLWRAVSLTLDGADAPLGTFFNWEPGTDLTSIQFFADGTLLSIDYAGADFVSGELGNWNTDGGVLRLNFDESIVMDAWQVVGDTATITLTLDTAEVAVVTFQRD